jgi:hypothetical protein
VSGRPLQRMAVVAACPAAYRAGSSGTKGRPATLDRCGFRLGSATHPWQQPHEHTLASTPDKLGKDAAAVRY